MTQSLKILSIDGGGIRGVSALLILESIMEKIQHNESLERTPSPYEYFDIVGGTSTGGIIAIMLGRLQMSVDECIRAYKKVAEKAFTPRARWQFPARPTGAFSATALESAIKEVIADQCTEYACRDGSCQHTGKLFRDGACCNTVVLAITKDDVNAPPTLFKTYDRSESLKDCTIWQVARATSAATTFFESIKCGRDEVEFIDAGFGYNNPCDVLIQEARAIFPNSKLGCVISIGTGLGGVVKIQDSRRSILEALKEMASSSKKVADRLDSLLGNSQPEIYYRFNVQRGLEDITLSDWKQTSSIAAHTNNYLQEERRRIYHCAKTLHAAIRNNSSIPSGTRDRSTEEASLSSNGDPITEIWSIDSLLDRLIIGGALKDLKFRNTFLATYPAFISCLFGPLESCFSEAKAKFQLDWCNKVISVMCDWVENPYTVIGAHVLRQMKVFAHSVETRSPTLQLRKNAQRLHGYIDTRMNVRGATVTARSPSVGILRPRDHSDKKIAAALTELERRIYSPIRPADYILHLRGTPISDHVTASQLFTLKIRVWVTQTLLSYKRVLARSRVFEFFLKIAKECRTMGNYSSASAIIQVLDSEPISILSETVEALDDESKGLLHELTSMFKSESGYHGPGSLQYPCLPILGRLLSDLNAAVSKCIHEVANGQTTVNWTACLALDTQLRDIIKFKPSSVSSPTSPDVLSFLRSQLENVEDDGHAEEECHRISKKLRGEERNWRESGGKASEMTGFAARK